MSRRAKDAGKQTIDSERRSCCKISSSGAVGGAGGVKMSTLKLQSVVIVLLFGSMPRT